jgi:hypothetical protein
MDWKYKHFNQEAVFKALPENVLEAARAVLTESLGGIENTADGFIAQGYSAWHAAIATFRIAPAPEGTKVAIELLVERAALRGYMLVDIGSYYNGQIDKWFSGISQRLAETPEEILVSKTTSNLRVQRGCLMGCLVYLLAGTCLTILAIPLDRSLFRASSGSTLGPFGVVASALGLLAGVAAFLYVMNPEARAAKFIREQLHRTQNKAGHDGDSL